MISGDLPAERMKAAQIFVNLTRHPKFIHCRLLGYASAAVDLSQSQSNRFSEALFRESKTQTIQRIQNLNCQHPSVLNKASAVLVSLCIVKGIPSLLYTLRSTELKNHSGQVSFPGGRCDLTDRDVIHTAVREAEEEIGVPQSSIDVWAVMPPIGRTLNTPVYLVVGNLGHIVVEDLIHNQSEVSMIFTVPLEFLCNPLNYRHTCFRTSVGKYQYPIYTYISPVFLTSPRVWGLTAVATELFLSLMFPDILPKPFGRFLPR